MHLIFMFKNLKVKKIELFIGAVLALVFIVNAPYAFAGPSCGYGAQEGRTIVYFPSDRKLVSSQGESGARIGPIPFTITAGTYDVTLVSYDGYAGRENVYQPRESWFLLLRSSGAVLARTNASTDLPDRVFEARTATLVNTNFVVSGGANIVEAFHAAYPDTSDANSVLPVCAVFDRKDSPPPVPPIFVPPTVSITSYPSNISQGNASLLSWTSSNATSCYASGGWSGSKSLSGSQTVYPTNSTTYVINCSNNSGQSFDNTTVTVQQQLLPTVSITSYPSNISQGNASLLSWTSSNATSCYASGGWSGSKSLSGSQTVYPTNSTTYVINCSNNAGQAFDNTTIYVNSQQTFPTVNLSVNPTYIQRGQSALLVWSSYNATSCFASGGWYGTKSLSGSENVSPSFNTTYTITCSNSTRYASDTDTVTVTTPIFPPPPIQTFNAACVASPRVARVGQTVAFAAGYAGGIAPYTFNWSQDISGTGLKRTVTFGTTGIKTARVIITDGIGRTAQGICSVTINPAEIIVIPPKPPIPPVVPPEIVKPEIPECEEDENIQPTNAPTTCQTAKNRSLIASLILNESGNPTRGGFFIIWYFIILFTIAIGVWMYYLLSNRKE